MSIEPSGIHDPDDEEDLEEQARAVAPFVLAYIEQNLHMPLQMPDPARLRELKDFDPELYKAWSRMIERQHQHDLEMEKAPFEVPARIARRGQWFGLAAVFGVLVLAGLVAVKGHPGWTAVITGIDVVALAAVFASGSGSNNDHSPRH